MDVSAYVRNAQQHCEELLEELGALGLESLAHQCSEIGEAGARLYFDKYHDLMCQYAGKTPAQRRKFRASSKLDDTAWSVFVLGALYHAQCAVALMLAVETAEFAWPGPYRRATERVALTAHQMLAEWPPLWPYEDLPDPFDGEASSGSAPLDDTPGM